MKKISVYILMAFFAFLLSCGAASTTDIKSIKSTDKTISGLVRVDKMELGELRRIDSFPSKFVTARGVDVWLPNQYNSSKKYNVLYMNDGQRLFTNKGKKKKHELLVDQIISKLVDQGKIKDVIVVGVHSIGKYRHRNYFPENPFDSLPHTFIDSLKQIGSSMNMNVNINSNDYLKFIVEELKPYIDQTYTTHKDYKNTFIGGASMGGLISMYAVCEYPEVFGGAICMSTHWPGFLPTVENPIPTTFFDYMRSNLPSPENHKFYFDFGTKGMDRFYGKFEENVNQVFEAKGYDDSNFKNLRVEGGNHSEEFWSKRFDIPLIFLLKNDKL